MQDKPIGFFDSGVGGLSVLKYALSVMPEENYIYFGDSLNAPYGTKSSDEVYTLTENAVFNLIDQGAKAIVIACNTATSISVDKLRTKTNIPIISMEPAIKPALEQTNGKVLLLATSVTISSDRVNNLITRFDKYKRVIKVSCQQLAKKIEEAVFSSVDLDSYLKELLLPYKNDNVSAVVLGCTHYPFISHKISEYLGENIKIYDGIDGTVSHLKDVLIENKIKNVSDKKGYTIINSSLNDEKAVELYNKLLNGGIL